jgi:hypothetical protein
VGDGQGRDRRGVAWDGCGGVNQGAKMGNIGVIGGEPAEIGAFWVGNGLKTGAK